MNPDIIARPNTEAAHQQAFFAWCALNKRLYPVLGTKAIFAIKNEEKTGSVVIGAKHKAMGVKAGVADIFLAFPSVGYNGLFVEMKKPIAGKQSNDQVVFEKEVSALGYKYCIAYGWKDAVEIVKNYMKT